MSAAIALHLLGTFELRIDDKTQTGFRSDKARALLAYLAVASDQAHRRDALAALLWPDQPEQAAKANLRNVLSNLRTLFKSVDASPLQIRRSDVRFDPALAQVDVLTFQALCRRIQRSTAPSMDLLQQATVLYRGDFLAGLAIDDAGGFDQWRLQRQERDHNQAMALLQQLSGQFQAQGAHQQAIQVARRQLELEPWHEPAHRHLIQALAATG